MANALLSLCSLVQQVLQCCLKFFAGISIVLSKIDGAQRKLFAGFSVFTKFKNNAMTLLQAFRNGILLPLGYSLGAVWILISSIMWKISYILFHIPQTFVQWKPKYTETQSKRTD